MIGMDLRKHYSEVLQDENVLLKRISGLKYKPYVHSADLVDILEIFKALPVLQSADIYPIASAGDLLIKLGDHRKGFNIDGMKIDPSFVIKNMPSYYFPIFDVANFIEKIAELFKQHRARIDVTKELETLKTQIGRRLNFPIKDVKQLVDMLGSSNSYTLAGRTVTAAEVLDIVPPELFPIKNEDDFYDKVTFMLSSVSVLKR